MILGDLLKGVIGPIVSPLLDLIPNKNDRARAEEKIQGQMLTAVTTVVAGQLAVNLKEAEHASIFVAGARPAILWICGFGLGWNTIVMPLLNWIAFMFDTDMTNVPALETGQLVTILTGMLGLGGLRTYEKRLGVARTGIKKAGE